MVLYHNKFKLNCILNRIRRVEKIKFSHAIFQLLLHRWVSWIFLFRLPLVVVLVRERMLNLCYMRCVCDCAAPTSFSLSLCFPKKSNGIFFNPQSFVPSHLLNKSVEWTNGVIFFCCHTKGSNWWKGSREFFFWSIYCDAKRFSHNPETAGIFNKFLSLFLFRFSPRNRLFANQNINKTINYSKTKKDPRSVLALRIPLFLRLN